MKKIITKELVPGMVLADAVLTPKSNILFEKGTILTQKDIAKLTFYSIDEVLVHDNEIGEIMTISSLPDGQITASERIKQTKEFQIFKADFEKCAEKFKNEISDLVAGNKEFDYKRLLAPIYELLQKGQTNSAVFEMLNNLRNYDDATYTHCINVALASNILAQWLRWSKEEIETATLSGLFHDIGKLAIPEDIITKPGKLTSSEYSIVKTHPQKGFDVLKNVTISIHVKNAALMHHERCDGTGYPGGLKAPQIDRYAKLVSITDVYDAMTSARYYRAPLCPFIAISMFEEDLQKYDTEMMLCFLENIVNTYMLNTVLLNTGEVGEIVFINRNYLSRPTIKIKNEYIDLSKCPGVYIQEIL